MADEVDGWYSWVVVAVCFVIYFLNYGLVRISGLFFSDIILHYNVDRGEAATPFFLASVARSVSGPVSGFLSHTFGFRFAIILGCFLSSLGIFACYFAKSISVLCLCWSVYGFGSGMATTILPRVINLFSKRHATKATGIAMCGSSAAGMLLPFLAVVLLNTYGMPGTFLDLSALMLNAIAGAILLRNPVLELPKHSPNEKDKCAKGIDRPEEMKIMAREKRVCGQSLEGSLSDKTCTLSDCENQVHCIDNHLQDMTATEHICFEQLTKKIDAERRMMPGISVIDLYNRDNCSDTCRNSDVCPFDNEIKDAVESATKLNRMKNSNESMQAIHLPSCECKYNPLENKNNPNDEKSMIAKKGPFKQVNKTVRYKPDVSSSSVPSTCPIKKKQNCLQVFDIFWDPVFLIFALPRCFASYLYILVPTIIVDLSIDKGVPIDQTTYSIILYSSGDLFGKLCLGWITDGNHMSRIRYSALWYCIVAFSFGLMAWSNGFAMMSIAVLLEAMGIATIVPTLAVLVSQYFEKDKQSMAFTSMEIFLLPLSFATSPLIGFFRDNLGSYDGLVYSLSAFSILCSTLILLIPTISNWRKKRKDNILDIEVHPETFTYLTDVY